MNERPLARSATLALNGRFWACSDLGSLSQLQSVLNIHAKVSDGAVDLSMAEKDLNGTKVTGCLVDDGGFRAPERMRSVILRRKTDTDYPLVHKAGVLPSAHVGHVVVPARENEVVQGAAPALEPRAHCPSGRVYQLELDRSSGFLLNDDGAITNAPAGNYIPDSDTDHVTAAQLAINREVEQRTVAQPPVLVEPKPNSPDLLLFQSPFGTDQSPLIPRPKFLKSRVHRGVTHRQSPYYPFGQTKMPQPGKLCVERLDFLAGKMHERAARNGKATGCGNGRSRLFKPLLRLV